MRGFPSFYGTSRPLAEAMRATTPKHGPAQNGVGKASTVNQITRTLSKTGYGEGTRAEVTLWTSQGAGHTWPGHAGGLFVRLFLGRTGNELDATTEIWRFFAETRSNS